MMYATWILTIATFSGPVLWTALTLPWFLLVLSSLYIKRAQDQQNELKSIKLESQQSKDQALIQEEKYVVEINRSKDISLAHISNELRTPLNVIIGYSELLQEVCAAESTPRLVPDIRKIATAAHHLKTIVNDMLILAKIESGKLEIRYAACAATRFLADLEKAVLPTLAKKNNQWVLVYHDQSEPLEIDVLKVRQLLTHLVCFANRNSERGKITLELDVQHEEGIPLLVFTVSDESETLPRQLLDALISGHTCLPHVSDEMEDDLGLGLAISKGLASVMGGSLEIVSTEAGNRIVVRLPGKNARTHLNEPRPEALDIQGKVVLIISDDLDNSHKLQSFLERFSCDTQLAQTYEKGLHLATTNQPDLIVIDGMMPQMNGWHSLEGLKRKPGLARIPVIMTSLMDEVGKTYALGAIGFLTKPVSEKKLLRVMTRYLAGGSRHLLLVEDDRVSRKMMLKTLTKSGFEVKEAENGQVALERVREREPELILLDLMMPEMGGYEFFSELRKHPTWQRIPVVFVSSAHLTQESKLRIPGLFTHISNCGDFGDEEFLMQMHSQIAIFLKSNR